MIAEHITKELPMSASIHHAQTEFMSSDTNSQLRKLFDENVTAKILRSAVEHLQNVGTTLYPRILRS